MEKVKFAIGFAAGRTNVCDIINSYYDDMLEQISRYKKKVELNIYILIDLNYQEKELEEFYKLSSSVLKSNVKIKYITPELINLEKILLMTKNDLKQEEAEMFIGTGHARCRNTILYYALKDEIDYLLFWDDDEYPVANVLNEDGSISWIKQDNILNHLEYIENCDVTIGHHCGYISPIPYFDCKSKENEESVKTYIEAISNDIVTWESIKEKFIKHNGVTYANKDIIDNKKAWEIESQNGGKWVAGSTLCLNLNNMEKIPAFFNPEGARGEDTFFSTKLNKAKVIRVPIYHFHDGFLKYTNILNKEYPETLKKITFKDKGSGKRFFKASIGWMKYKPLFVYITDKFNCDSKLKIVEEKLNKSIPVINKMFNNIDFNIVLKEFLKYRENVLKDFDKYEEINKLWKKITKSEKFNYDISRYKPKYEKDIKDFIINICCNEYGFKNLEQDFLNADYSIYEETGNNNNFFIMFDDEKIIGTIITEINNNIAVIKGLYVADDYRKKGIAQRLFDEILEYIKKQGVKNIKLGTYTEMTKAIKFYEKNGFIENINERIDNERYYYLKLK